MFKTLSPIGCAILSKLAQCIGEQIRSHQTILLLITCPYTNNEAMSAMNFLNAYFHPFYWLQ